MKKFHVKKLALAALLAYPCLSSAIVVKDDFTVSAAQNSWTASGGACLTAGSGQPYATGISVIPACGSGPGGATGTLPDANASGALRLTNNSGQQHGSIVYNANFPTDQGIQATFTTYAYNGDKGGTAKLGADGIGFFLLDGSLPAPANVGAAGGSLGYSCSNTNNDPKTGYDGITGGYIGLGMDEYGNFSTGKGDSTATGPGYKPNSIVLRGGGTITAAYLSSLGLSSGASDVQAACKSPPTVTINSTQTKLLDYPYITGKTLSTTSLPLAQSGTKNRPDAVPITYKLKITPSGLLSLWYSYNGGAFATVITNQNIIDPAVSGPLPKSFRFGFSGGTGGSTNIHEITCFTAAPANVSASSGGSNTVNGGQVLLGTQLYFSLYHPDNWWGQMAAYSVLTSNGVPYISSAANWDASCQLTGGSCSSMGNDSSGNPITVTAQAVSTRTVLTSNGSGAGSAFTWSGITTAQQNALNIAPSGSSDTNGQIRLNYLRGDRSQEQPTQSLRQRTGVLGDIIDSSPTWVGPPNRPYGASWTDNLYSGATAPETSYTKFATGTAATRNNVVYVGSNDGMVHGFQAGSYNADGTYNSKNTTNNGVDVLDYLPANILANLPTYTDPLYSHSYYVNATPATGDLFYNGAWHSWLVGGLGVGGQAIYALDVTDPTQFKETNASSLVIGEWNSSTLPQLGNTYGTPLIRRMHSGQWAVIFGNGFNSANGLAGVYIMLIDPSTGAQTFKWLSTGSGTTTSPNGISYVASADLDNDHVTDYLYAGDLQGNVWRFDVTSSNTADWAASTYGNTNATPIFKASATSSSGLQPITTQIQVASIPVGITNRIVLMFGTGQKTPFTSSSGDVYASGTQSVYGVWDWDMSKWNSGTKTSNSVVIPGSAYQYAALTGPQTIDRTKNLTAQTITFVAAPAGSIVKGYRTLSNATICWQGGSSCTPQSSNNQYGWKIDLPSTGEQIVYNPVLIDGALELNTAIPPASGTASCTPQLPTGWTMAFNPSTGGAFSQSYFPNSANTQGIVMGAEYDATGTPGTVAVNGKKYIYGPTVNGGNFMAPKNPPPLAGKRITWKQTK